MMLSSTGFGCVFVLYALDFPLCVNSLLIGYYLATNFFIQAVGTVLGLKYLSLVLPQPTLTQLAVLSAIGSLCCMAFVRNKITLFIGKSHLSPQRFNPSGGIVANLLLINFTLSSARRF